MFSRKQIWHYAIWLAYAALLAMLARTFLDYQYVYRELGLNALSSGVATLINLAIFGGWIYALVASTRFSQRAMIVNLVFDLLTLVFGISTVVSLCPSPCPTGWPVGEIIIWTNVVIGGLAAIPATLAVFRPVPLEDKLPGNRSEAHA